MNVGSTHNENDRLTGGDSLQICDMGKSAWVRKSLAGTFFKYRRCSLVVPRCWRVLAWCSVPVVAVPLPPGWCGWHPGFPSGMFHLFPSLLVRPSSVGFLPHLSLAVVGRWLSSSEGSCVGCQHLFPRCCRHAMFFFLGSVWLSFGSARS
ncbi:hypothetical protein GQ42DRAFT_160136 [Ramicandelaber brevisporus]|nr:hypothetical protein GQ42DRAFT_160136 [Ramicandelaber brevisporus]